MKKTPLLIICILCLTIITGHSQQIVINEVMASNSTVLTDEDGDYPDWIELYNNGAENININNWGISDSKNNPFKWVFPDVTLTSGQFLVIFASDKDRRDWIPYWHTIIDWGDPWKYFPGNAQPPANWNEQDFDDALWSTGNSGFGYGDGDDETDLSALGLSPLYSVYIRKTFQIDNIQDVASAILHIDYDDAFVAYINGTEFARSNIGEPGVEPAYNQGADNYDHEARVYQGGQPEAFIVENVQEHLVSGENVLAIQVHNYNLESSDMTCIPFFSIGLNYIPENPQTNPPLLNLDSPGSLHTNFKIDAGGETLFLTNPDTVLADSVRISNLKTDHSYGRQPDGNADWYYFELSTPGISNITSGYTRFAEEPLFSIEGGFYDNPVELTLESPDSTATIYYTLDGSAPDDQANVYSQPVSIETTTVVRAIAMGSGLLPSAVITKNYLIGHTSDLPVICLTTTPDNLWDNDTGIYVLGDSYEDGMPYYGANFWQDWERPVHVEMYENDGSLAFAIDGGMKIHGGWSRAHPQKSLAIFARSRYGYSSINYPLFENRPYTEYSSFVLRNSANDWGRTMFTDGMIQTLADSLDMEHQAYRPCVVYINGEYFGFLNIREKVNEEFIAMYHDVDPDNLDILEFDGSPVEGSSDHYDFLLDYISSHDMTLDENYNYIQTQMDVDNFSAYQAFQIYIDNRDWPGNNIKFWRPRQEDGRWRWILYDTEWGFGINAYGSAGNPNAYDYNTLEFATSPTQTENHHGNPPWSTFLLRNLLQNETFKNKFINCFADQMNSIFKSDHVLQVIDSIEANIENEIPRFYEKWSQTYWWMPYERIYWGSYEDWYYYNNIARDFAQNRPQYMKQFIIDKFELPGMAHLIVDIDEPATGSIQVNSLKPNKYPWVAEYFLDVPLEIRAIPAAGYQFDGWSGDVDSAEESLLLDFSKATSITAHFKKVPLPSTLVINEINYNSADDFDTQDWLEIFYDGNDSLDISGWLFKDEQDTNLFVFPEATILTPGAYYVLCHDSSAFKLYFPDVVNVIGNFSFGLAGSGDQVRLFTSENELVDSVKYNDSLPWPDAADGTGATLELKNPLFDNSLPHNWAASTGHGSPGKINSMYSTITAIEPFTLPDHITLQQNYPNPFNPISNFKFRISNLTHVRLSIYNLLGQKVATLVNEKLSPGNYNIQWDASGFSSGVYFYTLQTSSGFKQSRKLVLLK